MKTLLFSIFALVATTVPALAITVTAPANGAQVTSPFTLVANTKTCDNVPAASMGYSLDDNQAVFVPTTFTATVTASQGTHVLHVKCWGEKVSDEVLLNITVVPPSALPSIIVSAPASGAKLTSPFTLVASSNTCNNVPSVSMGYSIDDSLATFVPTSFSASVTASVGAHVLHVKCWGKQVNSEVLQNITIVPLTAAATPGFSPASGQYTTAQSVTLIAPTAGSTIYYTTDGSAPSTASPRYAGPIAVGNSTVIEAVASAPGYLESGMARADYVITPPKPAGPTIPSNAINEPSLQLAQNWRIKHDPGTPGTSVGAMSIVDNPSVSGAAAKFDTSFTNSGGELYSLTYGIDAGATNFVYDTEVWIAAGSQLINLEMDNNQVIPDGDTVIFAFQCGGYSNSWEYTENLGTAKNPVVQWVPSNQPCNPAKWTANAWHHVQIYTSRDAVGNVTYHSVWLDGVEAPINQTVPSAFTLGWAAGDLVANFQIDGIGASGSSTLYADNLTIYRW